MTPDSTHDLIAALAWQIELGADEAIGDDACDRFAESDPNGRKPAAQPAPSVQPSEPRGPSVDPGAGPDARAERDVPDAVAIATAAQSLDALADALREWPGSPLREGARNFVFADGVPGARLMVIGEAPGRDEDIAGKPFVGRAGQLLDRMFDAIEMGRAAEGAASIYITNILPWRPPQNRDPQPDEMAMMLPFVQRHVELVNPDVLVLMGNISCLALLGRKGITRMRGTWTTALDRPALPMFHPAYLLRNPAAKRQAWADLLALQARLRAG